MKDRIFFSGLNELLAFAALAVLFHHLEHYKNLSHLPSLYGTPLKHFIGSLGSNGVFLFFVLSGFLITYLLLSEIKLNGKISLRNFYARRILRIWPLYYIILLLSFFVLPFIAGADFFIHEKHYLEGINSLHLGMNLFLFIIFFSNLALILYKPVVGASQTWSVSVEEQFYGIWPLLMNTFRKKPWIAFVGVILIKPLLLHGLAWANRDLFHHDLFLTRLINYLVSLRIELMAIGGLGAWVLFNFKSRVERIFSDKRVLILIIILLAIQLVKFTYLFPIGITFLALILCFVCCKINIPLFNFFGTISYGIYMYHPIVMFACFAFVNQSMLENLVWYNILVYALAFASTIGISYLSFHYIEKRFLNLKERFSVVLSGKV